MKKLFDFAVTQHSKDSIIGNWSIINRWAEIENILDKIKNANWSHDQDVYYNKTMSDNLERQYGLSQEEVSELFDDPIYNIYQQVTFKANLLDRSEIELYDFFARFTGFSKHNLRVRYQIQPPGKMVPIHTDFRKAYYYDLPPEEEFRVGRYLIFLEDQQPGQVFQVNDDFIKWKKGDVLTWNHPAIVPHGTANFGFHPRPIVVITGFRAD
jgi:hypothetical protein